MGWPQNVEFGTPRTSLVFKIPRECSFSIFEAWSDLSNEYVTFLELRIASSDGTEWTS